VGRVIVIGDVWVGIGDGKGLAMMVAREKINKRLKRSKLGE
jgi:hypothetical protein